ncbi:MAG: FAD-binding oxidoreductase, partial [Proteobacteria bacterium]
MAPRDRLVALLGREAVLTEPADTARYLTDHRRLYTGRAIAVLRPRSVDEVAHAVAWCHAENIGVVPQGGNTGYCGGATPDETGTQVVLSLERLNRIRAIDAANDTLTAEAGCTLATVQAAAEGVDRLFPLSLGSEGSCQI